MLENIVYKSFCWVLGTTSFRTAKLNLKIEQQLALLDEFQQSYSTWLWNNETQTAYYDWLLQNTFVKGDAPRKDKDAREKTSGLVDIGLINNDRTLTEVGRTLLDVSKNKQFQSRNLFNLEQDSYIYFKQLLKSNLTVNNNVLKPYLVLATFLVELDYLTYSEFKYILPLAISN